MAVFGTADEGSGLPYEELRKVAAAKLANEKPGHTLQARVLIHEAYIRLLDSTAHLRRERRLDCRATGRSKTRCRRQRFLGVRRANLTWPKYIAQRNP